MNGLEQRALELFPNAESKGARNLFIDWTLQKKGLSEVAAYVGLDFDQYQKEFNVLVWEKDKPHKASLLIQDFKRKCLRKLIEQYGDLTTFLRYTESLTI